MSTLNLRHWEMQVASESGADESIAFMNGRRGIRRVYACGSLRWLGRAEDSQLGAALCHSAERGL